MLHWTLKVCARQSKSAELEGDIDIPMMLAPNVPMRRLRPEHDGTEDWHWDLGQIFSNFAETETVEGDAYLYVLTWYVDHQRHPSCRDPRPLRLDSAWITWLDEFRYLWRDLTDRRATFSVFIVRPRPPQPRYQNYACHVIVEQNKPPGLSAGVLTALIAGSNRDAMVQGAYSTPRFVRKQDLIDIMQVERFCTGRRCTAYHDQEPVHLVVATEVVSGFSIRLHIDSARDQMPHHPSENINHFEDLSLMQRGLPTGHAIDLPAQGAECAPFQFDAQAVPFQPGQLFISDQSEFVQDLYSQWTQTAFGWEDEARSANVITWFVDHREGQARCLQSRTVRLYANYVDWEELIKNAWQDKISIGQPLELHFVLPHPPRLEHNTIGHVIIIQAPHETWISSLVTVFDSFIGSRPNDLMRLVITTDEHVRFEHISQACGYGDSFNANIPCQVWIDEHHLPLGIVWPGRSGHNIVLQAHRQVIALPMQQQAAQGLQLLQRSAHIHSHAGQKQVLLLDSLLHTTAHSNDFIPVRLIHLVFEPSLPCELFLPDGYGIHDIEKELDMFGYQMHVYETERKGQVITVPFNWQYAPGTYHYIYCQLGDNADDNEVVLRHQTTEPLDDLRHMQFLHQLDFRRAVVVSTKPLRQGLIQVHFRNNRPALESSPCRQKTCSPWPEPLPIIKPKKIFIPEDDLSIRPEHCLTLGITYQDLSEYFESASDVLCPWYSHLDLPPFVLQGIHDTATVEGDIPDITAFDRLVIYTDGSSKPSERRKPPLRVAEQGTSDAWAFAVIGEKYPSAHHPGSLTLIGWQAQSIIYEEQSKAYTGTDQIGAEFSEREALLFAGLWRLALNSTIPTTFRTDSTTTVEQAFGISGFMHFHPTHALLRGTFQALQSCLGPEALDHAHVRGHAGDIWNEFVDFLAKSEAAKSHNLRRQQIDLQQLKHVIPYLWMLFDQRAGLPKFTPFGFDVHPPNIPAAERPTIQQITETHTPSKTALSLSVATFNVGSLFVGQDGYGGKLSFLRQQMQSHALNIVGVQEARSPEGMSTAEHTLRFSSGADHGKFGVELWISLKQPYGFQNRMPLFFRKSHFQVVHNDPRRLIVRLLNAHIDCSLVVLHAPQSGQPLPNRRTWWEDTSALMDQFCRQQPAYVMIDANAKTGPCSEPIVFQNDDNKSGNTDFFIDFLRNAGLCLPCTTDAHQGAHATWTSPDGLSSHRIDYVAIPEQHLARCCLSQVLHTFDNGNSHVDHAASALQLQWETWSSKPISDLGARTHDRSKVAASRNQLDSNNFHVESWECDIEQQVEKLNSHLHDILHTACPKNKDKPKKSFITDETWTLRAEKLQLHKRIRQSRKQQCRDFLAYAFRSWSGRFTDDESTEAQAHQVSVQCNHLLLTCRHWASARKLRQLLQRDKFASLNQVIADSGPQSSAGTLLHALKPFIGSTNLKKQKRPGLPIVRQADGTLCRTYQEAQSRWIAFFADMEGGRRMTLDEYLAHWTQGLSEFAHEARIQMDITEIPTLTELENAFRRVSPGKAVGLDAIPPEMCHYCPASMAKKCYTIMMKAALFGQESTIHKGGQMAVAWKHRGDVRDCTSHRSLLISSHVGKTVHRALRQKFHCLYTAYLQKQQLGGRPCMPVGIPMHMSRAFLRWKTREGQPTALLFLDLTEAFYRTLRPLAIGGELSDHCIGLMCQRLGFDPSAMQELFALLQESSALQEAGAPAHVVRAFRALHRDTWFKIGDQDDLVRTEIGSRPGDSFADIVFGFLWAKLLKRLESTLDAHGILEKVPAVDLPDPFRTQTGEVIPLLGPTWMDDLNILITAPSKQELVQKCQFALSLLLDECARFQMVPNLKKGKTEAMLTFRGARSREFRRLFYSHNQGLSVVCENATHTISVVSRYLHLGGIIHHRDCNKQEIKRRLAIAHQAFQQHRRLLYRNHNIAWSTRCQLFQSLILSKLTFGMESWTFPFRCDKQQIQSGIMKLYRKLLGVKLSKHLSDAEVLVETALPDPTELLRRERLRYFGTLHNCQVHAHWGVLQSDYDWIALIQDDLQWLWDQLKGSSNLKDPQSNFLQWQEIIIHHGRFWKKLIRKGIAHAVLQRKNEFHAIELHARIGQILKDEALVDTLPDHHTHAECLSRDSHFGCMQCRRKFATHAGERVHMCRTHGEIAPERRLFDDTHCPCCLREFHTHSKVLAHLRRSIACKETLQGRRLSCVPVPGVGSRIDQALQEITDGAQTFLQASGPHPLAVVRRQRDMYDLNFLEAIYLFLLDLQSTEVLETSLCRFIQEYPICWTECQRTLIQLAAQFTPADAEPIVYTLQEITDCLHKLADVSQWSFLQEIDTAPVTRSAATLPEWETWCTMHAIQPPEHWQTLQPMPRALTKQKILLHAFAGRRRHGDVEWFLEHLHQQHSGYVIITVSLDIIIDSKFGDISNSDTREFWLHYIRLGFIAGFLAGPPCNTWSKARSIALPDGKGPRVVRTPQAPWGIESLRAGELIQITLGTLLLGFALEAMLALALHDGSGILEHPRDSGDPDAVSIWRLPVVQMILQIPNMRLIHVAQGLFGAPSPKPTTLLTLRLPQLESCLHQGMLTKQLPAGISVGKDASGQFHTAPLKEYPPGLCRSIAKAFHCDFCTPDICVEHDVVPSALIAQCTKMCQRAFGEFIGRDWNVGPWNSCVALPQRCCSDEQEEKKKNIYYVYIYTHKSFNDAYYIWYA